MVHPGWESDSNILLADTPEEPALADRFDPRLIVQCEFDSMALRQFVAYFTESFDLVDPVVEQPEQWASGGTVCEKLDLHGVGPTGLADHFGLS